ncbi:MAG: tRNA (adenosine(37)-N6)-threonylcarbamoyltransferase complex ATPase subunit type 1 TsaE [Anaerolineae bacterium]|nr:tRNA (adenosine(37)-N6)-threonylcarbamoyltransferase complex ATPase subunit type 1 TsaE [Anaerolineae bacterium]
MAPILDEHTLEFVSRSPEQTRRLGARLGALLKGGEVICLEGSLGSGKTCLAQGIGRGWGVSQTLISPTFVLVREYAHPGDAVTLYHVDLYRISGTEEALTLGVDEFLGDKHAICVIEWAERSRSLMPEEHLWVQLEFADPMRRAMYFTAQGERHTALLQEFRHVAFGA